MCAWRWCRSIVFIVCFAIVQDADPFDVELEALQGRAGLQRRRHATARRRRRRPRPLLLQLLELGLLLLPHLLELLRVALLGGVRP